MFRHQLTHKKKNDNKRKGKYEGKQWVQKLSTLFHWRTARLQLIVTAPISINFYKQADEV